MDRHLNIFYYYRDRSRRSLKDDGSLEDKPDSQLEDNTTKALVNTLHLSNSLDGPVVLQHFLKKTLPNETIKFDKALFRLQVGQEESRPDAIIQLMAEEDVVAIAIESKLGSALDIDQLYRHLKTTPRPEWLLAITNDASDNQKIQSLKNDHIVHATWKAIYDSMAALDIHTLRPASKLLLSQFREFLAMNDIVFDPLVAGYEDESRLRHLWKLVKEIENRIKTDERFLALKSELVSMRKFGGYVGIRFGKNRRAHYNINFQKDLLEIDLTLYGVSLGDELQSALLEFVQNKVKSAQPHSKGTTISREQSLLMRYSLDAIGYRSKSKAQNDENLSTYHHTVNFYELGMNAWSVQWKPQLVEEVLNSYAKARKLYAVKQIDLGYKITIPDRKKVEDLRKKKKSHDIRVLDYEVLEKPESLVDEFVKFIFETKGILGLLSGHNNGRQVTTD